MQPNRVVRELRRELSMDQAQFAESIGNYQSVVSQVESGKRILTTAAALRIAEKHRRTMEGLSLTTEDLLRGRRKRSSRRAA